MPHRPVSEFQRGNAKRLRRDMTDAERALWQAVRAHRLAGLQFRRQAPIGPYIVDFFCAEKGLIVELDGGQHGTDQAMHADTERTEWLAAHGYCLIRFWNHDVLTNLDGVLSAIVETAGNRVTTELQP